MQCAPVHYAQIVRGDEGDDRRSGGWAGCTRHEGHGVQRGSNVGRYTMHKESEGQEVGEKHEAVKHAKPSMPRREGERRRGVGVGCNSNA